MNRPMRRIAGWMLALGWPLAAAAQDGITPTSVLIGQSAAFSGPAAQLGVHMRDGAKLWLDHVNAQGGIHGRTIQLRTRDDKYEANLAAENTRRFVNDDRVFALFAYVGTPTSQASLPIFTEARVPFVAPFTGAELLRQPFNRYVFNVRASYYDETEAIVDHLYRIGARRIAVFHQADSYGQAGLDGTTRALVKRNLKVHAAGTVQRNSTEVTEAVKTLNASQPDAVVMISAYASTAEFVRQMKKAGSVASFYTVSFVGSKALADALGDDGHGVTISQVVPFPWSPLTPVVREYLEFARRAQVEVNFSTLEGFIAAKVLTEGLRRAGRDLTRDRFIAALESIGNHDFGGFGVSFSPSSHSGSRFVDLAMIGRGGKFVR
ncbi:MAG: ABC transporter substrate-binding protein [Burkholderiales bacterium]|nr:ABC transporter substrate-binding protein [Burkholderiales bacterium]